MDETIRLIVEAQNRTKPTFQAVSRDSAGMSQALEAVGRASTATSRTFGAIGTGMRAAASAVSAAASRVRTAIATVSDAVHKAGAAFTKFGETARKGLDGVSGPLKVITAGFAGLGLAGAGALAMIGKAGVDMNSTIDRATAALTKMTGSSSVAVAFVEQLRKEAETSAPTLAELLPIAQQLAAAYGVAGLGKVIPTIRAFGDAAISLGVDTAGMSNALLGFRQLLGRDFAQQEEINQVRENLPGLDVGGILKRSFGTADTDVLKDAGVTGMQVGEALVRGMTTAFGGAQAGGAQKLGVLFSNFQDTFSRAAGTATRGFLNAMEGANGAVTRLLASFQKLTESAGFMGALTVVFDALGRVMEYVAGQADHFIGWLDAVLSRDGVSFVLANILGLLQTIGESILKTFGVDLKGAMDPKNVHAFFDALRQGANAGITVFFGLWRVAAEVVRAMRSGFEDASDAVGDAVQDTSRGIRLMFLEMQISIGMATATMLDSIGQVLEAVSKIQFGLVKPFAHLAGVGAGMRSQATAMTDSNSPVMELRKERLSVQDERRRIFGDPATGLVGTRQKRDALRLQQDPFRKDDLFTRIGDAFSGKNRPGGAEDAFRKLLGSNIKNIHSGLFGPAPGGVAAPAFPSAPMLYGGGGAGMGRSSVSWMRGNTPMIPSLPDGMQPVPQSIFQGSSGGQEEALAAEYRRQAGAAGPTNQMTQGGGYTPRGGGGGGYTVNVYRGMTWDEFLEMWMRAGEEAYRQVNPSPSSF